MRVITGDDNVFNMLVSTPNQSANNFVMQNIERLKNTANPYIDQIVNMRDAAMQKLNFARLALAHVDSYFKPDIIYPANNIMDLQTAKSEMRRWIMANPIVADLYQEQRCEGYNGEFYQLEKDKSGIESLEYQMVNDGIVQFTENDTFFTNTCSDNGVGFTELSFQEQTSIIKTWEILEAALVMKDQDPTSPYGNKL